MGAGKHCQVRLDEVVRTGTPDNLTVARTLGWFHWMRFLARLGKEDQDDFDAALSHLIAVYAADPNAPAAIRRITVMARL